MLLPFKYSKRSCFKQIYFSNICYCKKGNKEVRQGGSRMVAYFDLVWIIFPFFIVIYFVCMHVHFSVNIRMTTIASNPADIWAQFKRHVLYYSPVNHVDFLDNMTYNSFSVIENVFWWSRIFLRVRVFKLH